MLFLIFFITLSHSKLITDIPFNSTILGKETIYHILYPDTYDNQKDTLYPVVYLLHGMFDGPAGKGYISNGLEDVYNELLSKKEIKDMIIVMPYVENSCYVNRFDGTANYETYFHEEFMPKIESEYAIDPQRRAIVGLSMGGYAAMYYMEKYPEKFVAAQGMTASLWPEDYLDHMDPEAVTKSVDAVVLDVFNNSNYYNKHCPQVLIKNSQRGMYDNKHFRLAVGTDDYFYHNNHLWHFEMNSKDIYHQFIVRKGGHAWTFWMNELPLCLKWLNDFI